MGKFYEGQAFKIETTIEDDLTNASEVKLNVIRNDNNVLPQLTPTIVDAAAGKVIFINTNNELSTPGDYTIWPTYIDGDDLSQVGEPFNFQVFKQGT